MSATVPNGRYPDRSAVPVGSAGAGDGGALRAATPVAVDHLGQVDAHLIGERRHPGEYVAELVLDLMARPLADGLGEFAELLGEPGDGRGDPAVPVAVPVGPFDHVLEFAEVHGVDGSRRGSGTLPTMSSPSIHDLEMTSITGEQVSFDRFRGQVLLIVNVASA